MSMMSRLFQAAPPNTNQEESAEPVSVQVERVATGVNVDHLGDGDELLALASDATAPATQLAAQERLARLIEKGAADLPRLALLAPSTKLRQMAAEKIEDRAQLQRLLRVLRGKDKNVFKIVKRKCDAFNAERRQAVQAQADIVALGEAIERHSFKPLDGAFVATLDHFNAQWNAVADEAPPELQARVAHAIERSRETISKHLRAVAAQAAQISAVENAGAQQQMVLEEMRAGLRFLYTADEVDIAAANDKLARWTQRWQAAVGYKPASPADASAFESVRAALQSLSKTISRHGTLPQQREAFRNAAADADLASNERALAETLAHRGLLEGDAPETIAAAETALRDWQQSRTDKAVAAAKALRQLEGLAHKASRALDEGKSAQAAGMRRAIAKGLEELPSVPRHLSGLVEQLDQKLRELQDWKSYAVTPKRAELIEQMEALVGAQQDPVALAEQIKRLQEEWKAISKGTPSQSEADWQRFHRAAQAAYQPCREHFAEQARIRQENLEKRKQLVAQLAQYESATDWSNANWREVAGKLRSVRQHWRNYMPTERAATKPVQAEFDTLVERMQGRLDAEHSANIERKQALILHAQRLADESDTRKAIDAVRRLQAAWKTAGVVPHHEDQKLWESFRQHCDAVYQKSQQEFTQLAAQLDATKAKAIGLCTEAERLAEAKGAALLEGAARIRQLREEFAAVGDLPRSEATAINRKFERALERFDAEVAKQRGRDEQQRWINLLDAGNEVRLLQLATLENPAADTQSLRESARACIDAVQQWPKGGLQAVTAKLNGTFAGDLAANETALRTLCIRAEILTDTPTPAVDQPLRRNYQLQSLAQGFGRAPAPAREQMEAMMFEWIKTGPVATGAYAELLERFKQCWAKTPRRHRD